MLWQNKRSLEVSEFILSDIKIVTLNLHRFVNNSSVVKKTFRRSNCAVEVLSISRKPLLLIRSKIILEIVNILRSELIIERILNLLLMHLSPHLYIFLEVFKPLIHFMTLNLFLKRDLEERLQQNLSSLA